MLKKYRVKMNNKLYEMEIELLSEEANMSIEDTQGLKPANETAAVPSASGDGAPILAPLPGVVLDIKHSAGAVVKKGDLLLILEAMKMENEVFAPANGVIKEVLTSKGNSVTTGECLLVMA